MQLDRNISAGNIVSWVIMLIALAVGYGKMQSAAAQTAKDVMAATELAQKVDANLRITETTRSKEIGMLSLDVAVIRNTIGSMDKKLDDLSRKIDNR